MFVALAAACAGVGCGGSIPSFTFTTAAECQFLLTAQYSLYDCGPPLQTPFSHQGPRIRPRAYISFYCV